tara:strand:- start:73 stop:1422 length:1350 start_codon:yes stop_codon:yes gene_type:complete
MKNNITIVGSGLTGPLLATILSKKYNLNINMFERSADSRILNNFSGRSINLALSKRGINALKYADVYNNDFESLLIPMYGRTIHSNNGETTFQPYGNKSDHYINSVSRSAINATLMNSAEKTGNVKIHFNMKCDKVDLKHKQIQFGEKILDVESPIIGSDGYKSVVSKNIADINNSNLEYVNIEHSYKELSIKAKKGEYQMDPNTLHIWPRRDMMMIALPNLDKSFTCTLFMKSNGENSFQTINDNKKLYAFFNENFPDALNLISNLEYDFLNNPTGKLIGLRVPKWNYQDKALVIGDAAHATVPFYGQGMNASFEDCYIFGNLINEYKKYDWKEIFDEFYRIRKKDADSILDLSLDNYKVMRNDVLDDIHIKKQKLSFLLNNDFPKYFIPLYTMVSFTTIPYSIALERGNIQDKILNKLIVNLDKVENYDKEVAKELVTKHLTIINDD